MLKFSLDVWGQSKSSPEVSYVPGEAQIAAQSVTENANADDLLSHVICNTQDGKSALGLPYSCQHSVLTKPISYIGD